MPIKDGLTAPRYIKERWPDIRVITLTMYSASRTKAFDVGADNFLLKGCPAEELREALRECLGKKKTIDQFDKRTMFCRKLLIPKGLLEERE
jgi:DNA-binding NarL/FixJ family response regulator